VLRFHRLGLARAAAEQRSVELFEVRQRPPTRTYRGSASWPGPTPAACSSSSVNVRSPLTPSTVLRHICATLPAPGNRPDIPIRATAEA
jgi:hypothetical protein